MELKFIDKDKSEIFGAKDNSERRVNLRNFNSVFKEISFRFGLKYSKML
jgi:hypothetical protein